MEREEFWYENHREQENISEQESKGTSEKDRQGATRSKKNTRETKLSSSGSQRESERKNCLAVSDALEKSKQVETEKS